MAQTPEGIEFVLYPAGLPIRLCAAMIDRCAQGLLSFAFLLIWYLADLGEIAGMWLTMILVFCIEWFYHVVFEVFWRGQSPGKRILGIRVVRSDGSPVNPGASFVRNLLRFADTFMFLYLIVLIGMAVSRGFRRLGDWAADTLVVYTALSPVPAAFPARLSSLPPVNPPRRLSSEERQGILMFARRYSLLGKARADEIAQGYADRLGMPGGGAPAEYLLGIARRLSGDGAGGGP